MNNRRRHAERRAVAELYRACTCEPASAASVPGTACPNCGGATGSLRELRRLNQERIEREKSGASTPQERTPR